MSMDKLTKIKYMSIFQHTVVYTYMTSTMFHTLSEVTLHSSLVFICTLQLLFPFPLWSPFQCMDSLISVTNVAKPIMEKGRWEGGGERDEGERGGNLSVTLINRKWYALTEGGPFTPCSMRVNRSIQWIQLLRLKWRVNSMDSQFPFSFRTSEYPLIAMFLKVKKREIYPTFLAKNKFIHSHSSFSVDYE